MQISAVVGNDVSMSQCEDFRCFIPILINPKEKRSRKLIKDIPTDIYRSKINNFYIYLFPKNLPVIPPELGEYRLVVLWSHLKKLMQELYDKGWFIKVHMNTYLERQLERKLEETSYFNKIDYEEINEYERYLNIIEETVLENIVWPSSYPDVAHYLRVTFKPPRVHGHYIEVRYASTLCLSTALLDTEYFSIFLKALLKNLK